MFQDSHMFPQVWESAKEVNPKHFQVGITMVLESKVFWIFGTKVQAINVVQIGPWIQN
jgi:hypothetical protein